MAKAYKRIALNAAKCKNCGVVVVSLHVHDYRTCKCGKIAVDGGRDYLKRAGSDLITEELSLVLCWDNTIRKIVDFEEIRKAADEQKKKA